jgi:zinc/manganese transport system substrate-binding protein
MDMNWNSIASHARAARRPAVGWRQRFVHCAAGLLACLGLAAAPGAAADRVHVAASTTDLGSIAASVGGDRVEVVTIARSGSDPHRVEVLPSYMMRVARAQLYLKVGLGLDQWADAIIDGSHNSKLLVVDCSKDVPVLEKPTGKVDASMGDVHPDGNPHYWLDPRNAAIAAQTIAAALSRLDPAGAAGFTERAQGFAKAADDMVARGKQRTAALASRDLVTYHRSWTYFAATFDLNVVSTIEPIPGIPPTARHLDELVNIIKERKIQAAIEEPYFSEEAGKFLERQTGLRMIRESASCDDATAGSYFAHLDRVLAALAGDAASAH